MMSARQIAGLLPVVLLGWPAILYGQTTALGVFNPIDPTSKGLHLYGVSVFSEYFTGNVPFGAGTGIPTPNVYGATGPDRVVGAVATFGFNRSTEDSSFSVTYSPSFFWQGNRSQFNWFDPNFSLGWRKKLSGTLAWRVSAAAVVSDLQQLLASPTVAASIVSTPTTYDDLTGAILAGKYTDPQLASLLTGAAILQSPAQTFLYGNRILSATLTTGLTWTPTQRTSFQFDIAASRSQSVQDLGTSGPTPTTTNTFRVPQTMSGGVSLGWSYSLSPRTQIGATVFSSPSFSRLETGYSNSASVFIGRTLSRRWFVRASVGSGFTIYTRETIAVPHGAQYLGSANLGFKARAHTFMLNYNRTLADSYGLGSGSTSGATGAWSWRRPASRWSVSSSFGYQKLANLTFHSPQSWQASAGLGRSLSNQISMNLQYGYLKLPASVTSAGGDFTENGVTLSLNWSPSGYR